MAETIQSQATEVFERNRFLYRGRDAATYQYPPVLGLSAEPSGQVAHRTNRGVTGAIGKTSILHRDHRLRGEVLQERDLLVSERPSFGTI